jgi:N-acetylmuramate 1-kinase
MDEREGLIYFSREALDLPSSTDVILRPLGGRGSDRAYFRLEWGEGLSAILMQYDSRRVENAYFAEIAEFLGSVNIPVPRIIRHDPHARLILLEDLGGVDLWSLRDEPWVDRSALYLKTLAVVDRLHSFPLDAFPYARVRLMEPFGPDLYRWEREYFRDHFVKELCRLIIEPAFENDLERELSLLAKRISDMPTCLVHRDLQSQNVMVVKGNPFLIDFQGMRFGSPFYDLGSLLCDPYVDFSESEREDLLSFYYGLSERTVDWARFRDAFWDASAQRLMQALGAYGFLGLAKGLRSYLQHVPAALDNLTRAASRASSLPRLLDLCERCKTAIAAAERNDDG